MLKVNNVSFAYSNKPVLQNIDLSIKKGEIVSLVGESGSGKSTLLKAIFGLLNVENGSLFWNNKQLLGPNFNLIPGETFMKYVSQDFKLMPFISVEENIGKHLSPFEPEEKANRISELLELIDLADFAHSKVKNLSGGQQQRVALAQALAQVPELLLLDEPFSQVDSFRKNQLRSNLFSYLKKKQISCIIATHDVVDALSYTDTAIVIKDGKLIQKDTPQNLYNYPKNFYVASLFDDVNLLPLSLFNGENTAKKILLYPHELQLNNTEKGVKMRVRKSFFRGDYFLIEGIVKGHPVFFKHTTPLQVNAWFFINFKEDLLSSRTVIQ